MVFEVTSALIPGTGGGGLDQSIISGIEALLSVTEFDITATLRRDEDEFARSGIDTTCFITGVVPLSATPRGCAAQPQAVDTDGDGINDAFTGVAAGSTVTFEIQAFNDCVDETETAQTFAMWIDLFASDGTSLGTKIVTILVPPIDPKL